MERRSTANFRGAQVAVRTTNDKIVVELMTIIWEFLSIFQLVTLAVEAILGRIELVVGKSRLQELHIYRNLG